MNRPNRSNDQTYTRRPDNRGEFRKTNGQDGQTYTRRPDNRGEFRKTNGQDGQNTEQRVTRRRDRRGDRQRTARNGDNRVQTTANQPNFTFVNPNNQGRPVRDGNQVRVSPNRSRQVYVNAGNNPQPVYVNRPVYVQSQAYCPPAFYNNGFYNPGFYNPGIFSPVVYSDYSFRRGFRRFNNCYNPFLSLGFFLNRPYSYFDYASVDVDRSLAYGDENFYRPAPGVGGPEPDATTNSDTATVASAQPGPSTPEEEMIVELSNYVTNRSIDGRYQVADSAFGNKVWSLELAQAPAVFQIQEGLYSVVTGFEGTMDGANVPSRVNVEFFVAKTANGYEVKDSWIASANGIARDKLYQSPVYPDIKTWQPGQTCPFSKQPMVAIPQASNQG